jgi:hypothetical protein
MPQIQPNTITTFRNNFRGVRSNRFIVQPDWPTGIPGLQNAVNDLRETSIYIKAADIPEASIGVITVPWMGRAIKYSGERTYVDWSIQIYESNKQQSDLRRLFEIWLDAMDTRETHNINYSVTASWSVWYNDIVQGQTRNNPQGFTRGIKLKNCFPINVGTLQMDYDLSDSFAVFPVTLAFDYWEPLGELQ